jgi:hypothetical protein
MAPAFQDDARSADPAKDRNSHADQVKANQLREREMADKLGAPDVFLDSEADTCWYHWMGSIWVKPLRFENRSGTVVVVLKTDPKTELGKHRHRGEVRAYTVQGNWGYHE